MSKEWSAFGVMFFRVCTWKITEVSFMAGHLDTVTVRDQKYSDHQEASLLVEVPCKPLLTTVHRWGNILELG